MSIKYDWVKGLALGWLTWGKGTLEESAFQGKKGQSWVLFHGWCCTVSLVRFVKDSVKELTAGHWKSYYSLEQRNVVLPLLQPSFKYCQSEHTEVMHPYLCYHQYITLLLKDMEWDVGKAVDGWLFKSEWRVQGWEDNTLESKALMQKTRK